MKSEESNLSSDSQPSTSSKAKKRKYDQVYKEDWEEEFNWLVAGKSSTQARCKVCDKFISIKSGKLLQLFRHQDSQSHLKKKSAISKQPTVTSFLTLTDVSSEVALKNADCYIAAFIAEHNCPFRVAEHLPDLIAKICTDSEIAKKIKCGRTKTTAVVKNVIGETSSNKICTILKNTKFSIIIDEWTDLSTKKHLAIVARYFHENKIKDSFLTLIEMRHSRAADIHKSIVDFFEKNKSLIWITLSALLQMVPML